MFLDIADLREFYRSPLGWLVRRVLRQKLGQIWPDVRGESLLALGYGTPLLRPWMGRAGCLMALMPAAQGVAFWPREGPNIACMVELDNLPLEEQSVDKIVLLHALETSNDPAAVLAEVWRVLKPAGRAVIIVPYRRGFWAHHDATPFGAGRPYSRTQLRNILKDQCFFIESSHRALVAPPMRSRLGLTLAALAERLCPTFFQAFAGVLIVEVGKQIYAPTFVKSQIRGRRIVVTSSPLPTG